MTVALRGNVCINTASEGRNSGLRGILRLREGGHRSICVFLRLDKFSDCSHHDCDSFQHHVLSVSKASDLSVSSLLRRLKTVKVFGIQIQYSQTVHLNFGPRGTILTWPHISAATLVPVAPQPWQLTGNEP